MPLPQLTEPAGLPLYRAAGHGVQERAHFGLFAPRSGHSRTRRVYTASDRVVTVVRRLSSEQMAAWHAWYETTLVDAGGSFSALVANDADTAEADALWWEARFEAPPELVPQPGLFWLVNATLRLTGEGQAEPPYTGELGALVLVALSGTVRGSVTPLVAARVQVALLQRPYNVAALVTVPLLELPNTVAAEAVVALEDLSAQVAAEVVVELLEAEPA